MTAAPCAGIFSTSIRACALRATRQSVGPCVRSWLSRRCPRLPRWMPKPFMFSRREQRTGRSFIPIAKRLSKKPCFARATGNQWDYEKASEKQAVTLLEIGRNARSEWKQMVDLQAGKMVGRGSQVDKTRDIGIER